MGTTRTIKPMEATGKVITIQNAILDIEYKVVPIMRNGKPTKRNKEIRVYHWEPATASSYIIEGHEVYIIDKKLEEVINGGHWRVALHNEKGERIKVACQFGRYGKADHIQTLWYNPLTGQVGVPDNGYNGPCGVGWGAYIKRIEW